MIAEKNNEYLRLVPGMASCALSPTRGDETFADTRHVFDHIDPQLASLGSDIKESPTDKMPVQMYELIKEGNFSEIYDGFNVSLESLLLNRGQIVQFVEKNYQWCLANRGALFFLFRLDEKLFVARVLSGGTLAADFFSFAREFSWGISSRQWFVVPA